MTRREPEWDDQQRAWALALGHYRRLVHEPCGGYLPDTADPAAEGAYTAELPIRCHLCTERLRATTAHAESSAPHMDALLWPVKRGG